MPPSRDSAIKQLLRLSVELTDPRHLANSSDSPNSGNSAHQNIAHSRGRQDDASTSTPQEEESQKCPLPTTMQTTSKNSITRSTLQEEEELRRLATSKDAINYPGVPSTRRPVPDMRLPSPLPVLGSNSTTETHPGSKATSLLCSTAESDVLGDTVGSSASTARQSTRSSSVAAELSGHNAPKNENILLPLPLALSSNSTMDVQESKSCSIAASCRPTYSQINPFATLQSSHNTPIQDHPAGVSPYSATTRPQYDAIDYQSKPRVCGAVATANLTPASFLSASSPKLVTDVHLRGAKAASWLHSKVGNDLQSSATFMTSRDLAGPVAVPRSSPGATNKDRSATPVNTKSRRAGSLATPSSHDNAIKQLLRRSADATDHLRTIITSAPPSGSKSAQWNAAYLPNRRGDVPLPAPQEEELRLHLTVENELKLEPSGNLQCSVKQEDNLPTDLYMAQPTGASHHDVTIRSPHGKMDYRGVADTHSSIPNPMLVSPPPALSSKSGTDEYFLDGKASSLQLPKAGTDIRDPTAFMTSQPTLKQANLSAVLQPCSSTSNEDCPATSSSTRSHLDSSWFTPPSLDNKIRSFSHLSADSMDHICADNAFVNSSKCSDMVYLLTASRSTLLQRDVNDHFRVSSPRYSVCISKPAPPRLALDSKSAIDVHLRKNKTSKLQSSEARDSTPASVAYPSSQVPAELVVVGESDKQMEKRKEAIVLPMKQADKLETIGIKPPKGALTHGPPGTRKTLSVCACAAETGTCYFKLTGPSLVQIAKLVSDTFELAKKKAPAIIFIDEWNASGTKRSDSDKSGDRKVQRINTSNEYSDFWHTANPSNSSKYRRPTGRIHHDRRGIAPNCISIKQADWARVTPTSPDNASMRPPLSTIDHLRASNARSSVCKLEPSAPPSASSSKPAMEVHFSDDRALSLHDPKAWGDVRRSTISATSQFMVSMHKTAIQVAAPQSGPSSSISSEGLSTESRVAPLSHNNVIDFREVVGLLGPVPDLGSSIETLNVQCSTAGDNIQELLACLTVAATCQPAHDRANLVTAPLTSPYMSEEDCSVQPNTACMPRPQDGMTMSALQDEELQMQQLPVRPMSSQVAGPRDYQHPTAAYKPSFKRQWLLPIPWPLQDPLHATTTSIPNYQNPRLKRTSLVAFQPQPCNQCLDHSDTSIYALGAAGCHDNPWNSTIQKASDIHDSGYDLATLPLLLVSNPESTRDVCLSGSTLAAVSPTTPCHDPSQLECPTLPPNSTESVRTFSF